MSNNINLKFTTTTSFYVELVALSSLTVDTQNSAGDTD